MDNQIITLKKAIVLKHIHALREISENDELKKWNDEQILLELPKKFEISLGKFINNELVGFIIASEKEPSAFHIHKMMIRDDCRGSHYGSELIEHFINDAVLERTKKITLWVYDINKGAIKFYKKYGFEISISEDRVKDDHIIHRMIKHL